MKRLLLVSSIVLTLLLSGCVHMIQYITKNGDELEFYTKVKISKTLTGLLEEGQPGASLGSVNKGEFEEIIAVYKKDLGIPIRIENIDTEFDVGYIVSGTVKYKNAKARSVLLESKHGLVPVFTKEFLKISIPPYKDFPENSERNDADEAVFNSLTYTLIISKKVAASISAITILGRDDAKVTIEETGDVFIIELPYTYIFSPNGATIQISGKLNY